MTMKDISIKWNFKVIVKVKWLLNLWINIWETYYYLMNNVPETLAADIKGLFHTLSRRFSNTLPS